MEIPKEELEAIARNVKFPENEEWHSGNDNILEGAIYAWKEATKDQREDWKEGREFYDEIEPGLSDDGWDYIGPHYTYMSAESIIKGTPSKFFGPTVKRGIVKSILEDDDEFPDRLSMGVEDLWYDLISETSVREAYKNGKVSREFARVMKPYDNDDLAWEAIDAFYNSGDSL